ncbi:MAG: LysM peptidoglycan-binding domain-containing protein, partial [Candidatus Promineifilaceae bacterium]
PTSKEEMPETLSTEPAEVEPAMPLAELVEAKFVETIFSETESTEPAVELAEVGPVEAEPVENNPVEARFTETGSAETLAEAVVAKSAKAEPLPPQEPLPAITTSVMKEGPSPAAILVTLVVLIISFVVSGYVLRHPFSSVVVYLPTNTPVPPTPTLTPTNSPTPTGTIPPTETPTDTPTPLPTDTPKPPRFHTVEANETLFGLGLFYGVTADSIAEANGLPPGSGIQVSQDLVIPWPTATPPLVPIEVEVGGQSVIADPTDCQFYEIQSGDTLFGIASSSGVDLRALLAINRLNDQVVLQPGDEICIPKIIRDGILPSTPGPSPTPTQTPPPKGPQLLYPIQNSVVEPPEGPLVLQWAAVKDLMPIEWYMVEVTDLSAPDSHPMRGFTRQTAFRVPSAWRPDVVETHLFRWQVSIVQVTGERDDGSFIYTFGGNASEPDFFNWLGDVSTPPPTATYTPSPTPTPESNS